MIFIKKLLVNVVVKFIIINSGFLNKCIMIIGFLVFFLVKIKIFNSMIFFSNKVEISGFIFLFFNNWNFNSNVISMVIKLKLLKIFIGLDLCMIFGLFKYS